MQKVLVVEDDLDIQELLQNFLNDAGYEIILTNDGVEGYALFSDNKFDLVLLDILLPKIDGYGVCELIKRFANTYYYFNVKLQNDIYKEKKLEQARLEFFSAVSHELKTPITIIKGQLEGMLHNIGTYRDRDRYLAKHKKFLFSH